MLQSNGDALNDPGSGKALPVPRRAASSVQESTPQLMAHFGTVLFVPSDPNGDATAGTRELVRSLEADPRVITVKEPQLEPSFDWILRFYPSHGHAQSRTLLHGADVQHYLRMSAAVLFEVRVPKKNQPAFGRDKQAPSDKYIAAWNGCFLMTAWETNDDFVPRSGGHVVIDVLRDAAQRVGGDVYVQACSPGCDYLFTHVGLVVRTDSDADDPSFSPGLHSGIVEVTLPGEATTEDLVGSLYRKIRLAADYFAALKNTGRRVSDIQHAAEDDLISLLMAQHHSIEASTYRLWERLREAWKHRGSRKQRRELAARLLLHAANLEVLKREWNERRLRFERQAQEDQLLLLFANDHPLDAAAIETLSMDTVRATAEHLALRFENRALILATLGGAIAGGLVSAVAPW